MRSIQCGIACIFLLVFPFAAMADWVVASDQSEITYLSSKMTGGFATVFEHNHFKRFSGAISDRGEATLNVDLNSVDTGVAIRNERVIEHVFDVAKHPQATVSLSLGREGMKHYPPGHTQKVEAALTMRGVTRQVKGRVAVTQGDGKLLVQTIEPILVNAADYGMLDGFETLKDLVKLFNIPTTIPVSFKLVFTDSGDGRKK